MTASTKNQQATASTKQGKSAADAPTPTPPASTSTNMLFTAIVALVAIAAGVAFSQIALQPSAVLDSAADTDAVAKVASDPKLCGNGVVDVGEECDDGNILDGDGCLSDCTIQQFWVCPGDHTSCHRYEKIERVDDITMDELIEKYYSKGLMVILGKKFTEKWPAMTKWNVPMMKERWPDLEVEIQTKRNSNPTFEMDSVKHKTKVTMGEYVDMLASVNNTEGTNDFYMTANNQALAIKELKPLLDEMEPCFPGFIKNTAQQGSGTYLWLGAKGIITPIHHDPVSLFHTHIRGRKRWDFFAPDQKRFLYNHIGVYSRINFLDPDNSTYPEYEKIHTFHEILQPGETLFMPVGWWHHVQSLDECMGVSFTNFVPSARSSEIKMYKKWGNRAGNLYQDEATVGSDNVAAGESATSFVTDEMVEIVQQAIDNSGGDIGAAIDDIISKKNMATATIRVLLWPQCSTLYRYSDWITWLKENVELNVAHVSILKTMISASGTELQRRQNIIQSWHQCFKVNIDALPMVPKK